MRQALFPTGLDPERMQVEAASSSYTTQNLEMMALGQQSRENTV